MVHWTLNKKFKFKCCQQGALHLVLGSGNKRTFAIRRNWETLLELWPAIAQAQRFEKPSILKIVDDIITKVCKSQETIAITVPVSLIFLFLFFYF
jgi:hypothetical protein